LKIYFAGITGGEEREREILSVVKYRLISFFNHFVDGYPSKETWIVLNRARKKEGTNSAKIIGS